MSVGLELKQERQNGFIFQTERNRHIRFLFKKNNWFNCYEFKTEVLV